MTLLEALRASPLLPGSTASPIEPGRVRPALRDRGLWLALGIPAAVAAVVFLAARDALTDDALITLSFARTLGLHGEWGMIPGIRANSQTSPLNALLMGAGTAVVRSVIVACGLLWMASMAAVGGFTRALALRLGFAPWAGAVAGTLLATSPLMASTIGLESSLAAALIVALAWALTARGPVAVGVIGGLLVLTRIDLGIFVLVAVVMVGRRWWQTAAVASLVGLPWFVFAWYVLGSAIPDSLLFKNGSVWQNQAGGTAFEAYTMLNGPVLYLYYHRAETIASLAVAGVGLIGVLWLVRAGGIARRPAAFLGLGGIGYWAALCVVNPGPCHWYYAPTMSTLAIAGTLAAASAPPRWQRAALGTALAVTAGVAAVCFARPLTWTDSPIGPNYASAGEYARVADDLPDGPVASPGEVGALVFYCNGRCQVLDFFSDSGLAAPYLAWRIKGAGDGLVGTLLRWNYTHYPQTPYVPVQRTLWFRDGARSEPPAYPTLQSWLIDSRWHPNGEISLRRVDKHPWVG